MCESVGATRDHAPPLCLFPQISDTKDKKDYRKNLITVPACEAHNLHSSRDDEYLRNVLLHGYMNGPAARIQIEGKMARAMEEKPLLYKALYKNLTDVTVDGLETAAIDIDVVRFRRALEKVIRAIYFHATKEKLLTPLQIQSQHLLAMGTSSADSENANVLNFARAVATGLRIEKAPVCGENPEVFTYQLARHTAKNLAYGRFVFFEGFDVFFSTRPSQATPAWGQNSEN